MPAPAIVVAAGGIATALLGIFALEITSRLKDALTSPVDTISGIIDWIKSDALEDQIANTVATQLAITINGAYNITLDPDDPFSVESLTSAISSKTGIPLTDVTDGEAVFRDVGSAVTERINNALGTSFSNLAVTDLEIVKGEIKNHLMGEISRGLNGEISVLDQAATAVIVDQVKDARALTEDPNVEPETVDVKQRRLANRSAARKSYQKRKLAGYRKVYRDVNNNPPFANS
jgi:hypothetical protein